MRHVPMMLALTFMAGCATTNQSAEDQCAYFAREEGLEWVRNLI